MIEMPRVSSNDAHCKSNLGCAPSDHRAELEILDELKALDFSEATPARDAPGHSAVVAIEKPLAVTLFDELDSELLATVSTSSHIFISTHQHEIDQMYLKHVSDTKHWESVKGDPIFAIIPGRCPTTTWAELQAAKDSVTLVLVPDEGGDDAQSADEPVVETKEQRLAREQEEKLATLGVTRQPKPVDPLVMPRKYGVPSRSAKRIGSRNKINPSSRTSLAGRAATIQIESARSSYSHTTSPHTIAESEATVHVQPLANSQSDPASWKSRPDMQTKLRHSDTKQATEPERLADEAARIDRKRKLESRRRDDVGEQNTDLNQNPLLDIGGTRMSISFSGKPILCILVYIFCS